MKKLFSATILVLILSFSTAGYAIILPDPFTNAFQYGDFYSYSLPILAYQYDALNGGGVGPGNPYYVPSSPGAIKDLVVVATGTTGNPVNTNFAGMNNAYRTPDGNSSPPVFSTENTVNPPNNPIPAYTDTWNSTLAAFTGFLGTGNTPVFFFNNNQTNSGDASNQTLWAWGQVILRDTAASNPAPNIYFDFSNNGGFGPIIPGSGYDVTDYNSPGAPNSLFPFPVGGPYAGLWPAVGDFVTSGGQVTIPIGPGGTNVTFNHNLGANQAAYAIFSPELNDFLNDWSLDSDYDAISIDLRMFGLNNGYEQLFIATSAYTPPPIPEPSTFALLGAGLLGLGYIRLRKSRK